MSIAGLMVCMFIGGNFIIFIGILIWIGIIDVTEGEIDYAMHSDTGAIPRLRRMQHTTGNFCFRLYSKFLARMFC